MNWARYYAAMWLSEIWYAGFEERKDKRNSHRFSTYCRVKAAVRYDQVMLGRIKVEP